MTTTTRTTDTLMQPREIRPEANEGEHGLILSGGDCARLQAFATSMLFIIQSP
jgi:hypothetical protein